MSFILDALKKSETDRQQKVAPGIADVPTATRQAATSRWIPLLAGLLVINLGAVAYVLLRPAEFGAGGSAPTAAAIPAPAESSGSVPVARAEPAAPKPTAEPSSQASATSPEETGGADAAQETVPRTPEPAPTGPASTAASPERAANPATAVVEPAPADPPDEETGLTLNDLRASGRVDLPDMHIDLHVYSRNPAERFVFINMQQYRENATMAEGPQVRRITPEGVLLDYRGSTFLLPRE